MLKPEKFADTKGVLRIRKLQDRQYNGQKKRDKRTDDDPQNTKKKTKDRTTLLKTSLTLLKKLFSFLSGLSFVFNQNI